MGISLVDLILGPKQSTTGKYEFLVPKVLSGPQRSGASTMPKEPGKAEGKVNSKFSDCWT